MPKKKPKKMSPVGKSNHFYATFGSEIEDGAAVTFSRSKAQLAAWRFDCPQTSGRAI